jgi:hypothetical protein
VGDQDDVSLEVGLERGISIYNNFATRFLWGGESLDGELPPDALERAKENLARFAFVGVTERLDEGMILLGRMLDVPLAGYHLRHVRDDRPKASEVPDSLIRLIEEHNALDIELYRIARERFDAEAAAAGDVSAQVEELMRQRAEVTEAAEAQRIERKTAGKARRRAAKRERGGRRPGEAPDAERDPDELREELAALRHRLGELETALGTGESAEPEAKSGAHRGLHLPWWRRQAKHADAAQTKAEQKVAKQKPAGAAAKRARGEDRYGPDGDRTRKPRKRSTEKVGGKAKKARPQLPDDPAAALGDEPEPDSTADAA